MTAVYLLRPVAVIGGPSAVVRAACETCARSVAAEAAGLEGTTYWRDPGQTEVAPVLEAGKRGIILRRD
ncbi:hypothetical protein D3C78_298020 [compost metagenome]